MSARKLSRLAGLVFALAAAFGGISAASVSAERDAGNAQTAVVAGGSRVSGIDIIWS